MKKLLICLFIFFFHCVDAQENWLYISTDYDYESTAIKEVIPIVNKNNNHLVVLFKERKIISGDEYDKDHVRINKSIKAEKLPKKAKVYIGNSITETEYVLFFSNESKSKFASVNINFLTGDYTINEDLGLSINKEFFISYFNQDNKLYALTVVKDSSTLNLYTLDSNGAVKKQSIDLSNYSFKTSNDNDINAYNLISGKPRGTTRNKTIVTGEPSSLEMTSAQNKIYFENGKIKIISDRYEAHTYLINVDIKNSIAVVNKFVNEYFDDSKKKSETNSFVFEDTYFRVYSSSNRLALFIHDLETKEKIKTYFVHKNDSIGFKNTAIISQSNVNAYKEIENTNKFLRRITNSNLGVAVHKVKDHYVVTIGASEEFQGGSGPMIPLVGIAGGAIGVALFTSFSSYATTSSTYIKCLFDENFNHIKGEVPLNGFDKINTFIRKSGTAGMPHQTVFKYRDNYIWGSYNKSSATYGFLIFEE